MNTIVAETIRHELDLAMWLLIVGFNQVSASPNSSEAVIMRSARYLLENLYKYVEKQEKNGGEARNAETA